MGLQMERKGMEMKKFKEITNINKAIKYLERNVCQVDLIGGFKWSMSNGDEFLCNLKDDKELIAYANEQKEAIED